MLGCRLRFCLIHAYSGEEFVDRHCFVILAVLLVSLLSCVRILRVDRSAPKRFQENENIQRISRIVSVHGLFVSVRPTDFLPQLASAVCVVMVSSKLPSHECDGDRFSVSY